MRFIVLSGEPMGVMELISFMNIDVQKCYKYSKTLEFGIDQSLFVYRLNEDEEHINLFKNGLALANRRFNRRFMFDEEGQVLIHNEYNTTSAQYAELNGHNHNSLTYALTLINNREKLYNEEQRLSIRNQEEESDPQPQVQEQYGN